MQQMPSSEAVNNAGFPQDDSTGAWWRALLPPDATLEAAMTCLNDTALGIVMVVDDDRRLLGVATDGDIRRAVLAKAGLSAPLGTVMNTDPLCLKYGEFAPKDDEKRALVRGHPIPVLSDDGIVVGLIGGDGRLAGAKRENWVLLMAGGFGKRLGELTRDCPKPMLKVGGRPILERIVEQFVGYGFHKFYISVHFLPEVIMNHFGDGSRLGVTIKYLHEEEPLGTGGALGLIELTDGLPIVVMNSDLLTKLDLKSLLEFHDQKQSALTVCVREYDMQVPFGVVEGDGGMLQRIVEKPLHRFFVNAGVYVVGSDVIESFEFGRRIDMPELINELIATDRHVGMFPIFEYWLDVGRPDDFMRAQSFLVAP